ncbi:MAG: RNA polymerase sigma factor [Clostridiales Family XIII bacterium]|jgi:RNA polymerase sigma factor (sigma-70 family)|nr:RNA polymerase sigma factor [Clostridiales Family XIII bacterium]
MMTREQFYAITERAKNGDEEAFKILIENKLRTILLQSMNILNNRQDAEDATQEVVISVYRNISKLQNPQVFNAWLHRIIINTCNTMIGKKTRRKDVAGLDDFYETAGDGDADFLPQESLENKEGREELRRIVESLPKKRREALKMYYFDEMSYAEIARSMGVTVSAVSTYILKAKRQIKKKYEDAKTRV